MSPFFSTKWVSSTSSSENESICELRMPFSSSLTMSFLLRPPPWACYTRYISLHSLPSHCIVLSYPHWFHRSIQRWCLSSGVWPFVSVSVSSCQFIPSWYNKTTYLPHSNKAFSLSFRSTMRRTSSSTSPTVMRASMVGARGKSNIATPSPNLPCPFHHSKLDCLTA